MMTEGQVSPAKLVSPSKLSWFINDSNGIRQQVLADYFHTLFHITRGRLHQKGYIEMLLRHMQEQRPELIWIHIPGTVNRSGCRNDKYRADGIMKLALCQLDLGGHVILEASSRNLSWEQESMKRLLARLTVSAHQWCNYGIKHPDTRRPISTTTTIVSSFTLETCHECHCGEESHDHVAAESGAEDWFVFSKLVSSILAKSPFSLINNNKLDKPKIKTGALHSSASNKLAKELRRETANNTNTSSSSTPKSSILKRVQFADAESAFIGDGNSNSNTAVVLGNVNGNCGATIARDSVVDIAGGGGVCDNSFSEHLLAQMRDYKQIVDTLHSATNHLGKEANEVLDKAFPTVAALRAKEKRKADKAAGREAQKRPQIVEEHYDDCGDDLSAIDLPGEELPSDDFFTAQVEDEEVHYDYVSGGSSHSHCGDPERKIWKFLRSRHWLFGSEVDEPLIGDTTVCDNIDVFVAQARQRSFTGQVDVIELFGGNAGTTKVLLRRYNAVTGENFDIITGYNLLSPRCREVFWNYMREFKPVMVIMAPPCTGMAGWKAMNRAHNYDAWHRSRTIGIPLAKFAAEVAEYQLKHRRHFLVENPKDSDIFQLPEWQRLRPSLATVTFDQCMTGLKGGSGNEPAIPIAKPTEIWASHELLVKRLRDKQCDKRHSHARLGVFGTQHRSARAADASMWPVKLCGLIADGIHDILEMHFRLQYEKRKAFPSVGTGTGADDAPGAGDSTGSGAGPSSGPAPKAPAERKTGKPKPDRKVTDEERKELKCKGCRGKQRFDHPLHNRIKGECLYPDVEANVWNCPACKKNLPRIVRDREGTAVIDQPHTFGPDCQWSIHAVREGASVPRLGKHPRDPRIPAAGEPTSTADLEREAAAPVDSEEPLHEPTDAEPESAEPAPRSVPAVGPDTDDEGADSDVKKSKSKPIKKIDAETQAMAPAPGGGDAPASWARYDLGSMLQELKSARQGVVRRALRRLHIRWWHCGAKRMQELLRAAGAPSEAVRLIPDIVDTCRICRAWQRPGNRSISTSRLTTSFNEVVLGDLLFYKDKVILHLMDETTRWTVAVCIPNKLTDTIKRAFREHWYQKFDAPQTLLFDHEGGIDNDEMGQWLQNIGTHRQLKAPRQHVGMVERHHEILRQQLHKLEADCTSRGLRVDFNDILQEAVLAKNVLLSVGGYSPYQAVYGRVPAVLRSLETEEGPDGRTAATLRELAISSMVEATARERAYRADRSKSRPSGELNQYAVGDLVEFYRPPDTKDATGWKGPAMITDVSQIKEGLITIKWQSSIMSVRLQDCRRALVYASFIALPDGRSDISELVSFAEGMSNSFIRLGYVFDGKSWSACKSNRTHGEVLDAALRVAAGDLGLTGVTSVRIGRGVAKLEGIAGADDGVLLWWPPGCHQELNSLEHSPTQRLDLQKLFGSRSFPFIQFITSMEEDVMAARKEFPEAANIGGFHDPQMPRFRQVDSRPSRPRSADS